MSNASGDAAPGRTLSDTEALDKIAEMYATWGEQEIFEDSTVESIGDIVEQTGRRAWSAVPVYLKGD